MDKYRFYRRFELILTPEEMEKLKEKLSNPLIKYYAYILHKKELSINGGYNLDHYHVYISSNSSFTKNRLSNFLELPKNSVNGLPYYFKRKDIINYFLNPKGCEPLDSSELIKNF